MRKGDSRMKTSKVVSLLLVSWSKYIYACLKILKMIGESKEPLYDDLALSKSFDPYLLWEMCSVVWNNRLVTSL